MVDVASLDVSAVIEQIFGDFDRAGKMQRSLTIAAASVDEVGIGGDELAQFVEHGETSGGMRSDHRAALDSIRCKVRAGGVEQAKASSPPTAPGVNIRASGEKHIEHRATARVNDCRRVEWANGII